MPKCSSRSSCGAGHGVHFCGHRAKLSGPGGPRVSTAIRTRHAPFSRYAKEPCKKDLLAKRTISADKTVLREFADLANRLGFESPEITALEQHPLTALEIRSRPWQRLLVRDGPGEIQKRRCGWPGYLHHFNCPFSTYFPAWR